MATSPGHRRGCARLGIARLKDFRLNVYEPVTYASIDGTIPWQGKGPGTGFLIDGATVEHQLNDQVDTAQFTARGWTPLAGARIDVYSGAFEATKEIFAGLILETTQRYLSKPANVVTDVHCVDPAWLLSRTKVLVRYVGQSASAIIGDIITRFARGIGILYVQAGLPVIPDITFTNEDVPSCLSAVCQQVGAYWFVDYANQLHVFTSNPDSAANSITQANPGKSSDHQISEDLSQVITRVIGLGGGVGAAVDLPPGSTEIPIEQGNTPSASWYDPNGGYVQCGAQRVYYAGLKGANGKGAILGTGNAPTNAPLVAPASGAGLATGTYKWAITYRTAAGETLLSPIATMQTGGSAPNCQKVAARVGIQTQPGGGHTYTPNANYIWRIAVLWSGGGFSLGPPTDAVNILNSIPELALGPIATDPVTGHIYNSWLLSGAPTQIVQVQVYATLANSGAPYYHVMSFAGAPNTRGDGYVQVPSTFSDAERQANNLQYPTGPLATFNAAAITLPKSPSSSVTGRTIYRSAVNGTALKKLVAINDNTTTTYTDTNADGALTTDPPATDTSQLREDGQIAAGASALLVTDTTPFSDDGGASGGWVLVGNMTVRYTGISGQSLTGIPASGPGSITSTVRYGEQVIVHPRLVGIAASGVNAIVQPILKGDQVTMRMELWDQPAATAIAQRLGSSDYNDGIIDGVLSDSRFQPTELYVNCLAMLTERKDPRVVVSYSTRDLTHEVGRLVTFDLTTPKIAGTFRIQKVAFSEISYAGTMSAEQPKRRVEATNKLYTFADILRRLRGSEALID